jgi:hypothetical protein
MWRKAGRATGPPVAFNERSFLATSKMEDTNVAIKAPKFKTADTPKVVRNNGTVVENSTIVFEPRRNGDDWLYVARITHANGQVSTNAYPDSMLQ